MATIVLAEGARHLVPVKEAGDWRVWAASFGTGLRKTLLAYRDGARTVAGTRLTNTEYMKIAELLAARLRRERLHRSSGRRSAQHDFGGSNYTLSFVMEEQAVFPRPGERSPQYDLGERNAKLDPKEFPMLRQSGAILFDRFDRRYKEGLNLILRGASTAT